MKKLLPLVVILGLVAGAGYYYQSRSPQPQEQSEQQMANEAQQFAQAIESGRPTTCKLTKGSDTLEYLLKGQFMRANITSSVEGTTTVSHMVNDGSYVYVWVDGQTQGSKMSLAVPSSTPQDSFSSAPQLSGAEDYNAFKDQGYSIVCQASSLTDSDFTPPSNITFVDPSTIVNTMPVPDADGQFDPKQLEELKKQFGDGSLIQY